MRVTGVRVLLNRERDEVKFVFSDERQTDEGGSGYMIIARDEANVPSEGVQVHLSFENHQRLLSIRVRPASVALPPELLAEAEVSGALG